MSQGFRLHEDTLSQQAVDLICKQPGVQNERYLYRNTTDDRNVLVDYGFENLVCESTFSDDSGIVQKDCNGYNLTTVNESENRYLGISWELLKTFGMIFLFLKVRKIGMF